MWLSRDPDSQPISTKLFRWAFSEEVASSKRCSGTRSSCRESEKAKTYPHIPVSNYSKVPQLCGVDDGVHLLILLLLLLPSSGTKLQGRCIVDWWHSLQIQAEAEAAIIAVRFLKQTFPEIQLMFLQYVMTVTRQLRFWNRSRYWRRCGLFHRRIIDILQRGRTRRELIHRILGGGILNLRTGKRRRRGNRGHSIGKIEFGVGPSQTIHCGVVGAGGLFGSWVRAQP